VTWQNIANVAASLAATGASGSQHVLLPSASAWARALLHGWSTLRACCFKITDQTPGKKRDNIAKQRATAVTFMLRLPVQAPGSADFPQTMPTHRFTSAPTIRPLL